MRTPLTSVVAALGLALSASPRAVAQEKSPEELAAGVNALLAANSYTDSDGQRTTSKVTLGRGGTLVVEVDKLKGGNHVANVYQVAVTDIDVARMETRDRGDYTAVSLGVTGTITASLRCTMANGVVSEWNLPKPSEVAVEFKSGVGDEVSRALRELIEAAQKRTTT
jgi:hypothetical protein